MTKEIQPRSQIKQNHIRFAETVASPYQLPTLPQFRANFVPAEAISSNGAHTNTLSSTITRSEISPLWQTHEQAAYEPLRPLHEAAKKRRKDAGTWANLFRHKKLKHADFNEEGKLTDEAIERYKDDKKLYDLLQSRRDTAINKKTRNRLREDAEREVAKTQPEHITKQPTPTEIKKGLTEEEAKPNIGDTQEIPYPLLLEPLARTQEFPLFPADDTPKQEIFIQPSQHLPSGELARYANPTYEITHPTPTLVPDLEIYTAVTNPDIPTDSGDQKGGIIDLDDTEYKFVNTPHKTTREKFATLAKGAPKAMRAIFNGSQIAATFLSVFFVGWLAFGIHTNDPRAMDVAARSAHTYYDVEDKMHELVNNRPFLVSADDYYKHQHFGSYAPTSHTTAQKPTSANLDLPNDPIIRHSESSAPAQPPVNQAPKAEESKTLIYTILEKEPIYSTDPVPAIPVFTPPDKRPANPNPDSRPSPKPLPTT